MMLQPDKNIDHTAWNAPVSNGVIPILVGLGVLTLVAMWTSASPLVVLASGIVCILVVLLLWRPGEFRILLLVPVFVQFTEVALKPITTAFTGSSLLDLADSDADLEPAALLGLVALAALALGLRIGLGRKAHGKDAAIEDWQFRQILALALVAIVAGHAFDLVAGRFGGGQQIGLALAGMKWAGVFALAYSTFQMRRGLGWLVVVVVIELVLGMTGFFSEFRLVLFVLFGAMVAAHRTVGIRAILGLGIGAVLTVLLAVFWSGVKTEYRGFLNEGTGAQVVLRPLDERLDYLAAKAIEFDSQQFSDGWELLLARLSYIDFLAATIERVPKVLPHEGGKHLGEAILHVLTPRILFPDKPDPPSDTVVTAYYTGLESAVWADLNTSISIGYVGELYIDFGAWGAVLAVVLLGVAFGWCFRTIRDHPRTPAFVNYGLCMMMALTLASFGTALIKVIGGFLISLAAALVLQRLVWPFLVSLGYVSPAGRQSFTRDTEA